MYYTDIGIVIDGIQNYKTISKIVRIQVVRLEEYKYTYRKFDERIIIINLKSRNVFHCSSTIDELKSTLKLFKLGRETLRLIIILV